MSRTTKQEEETMEFPVDEFTMPSNFARKHVLRHSREAREAVANTSEASATQSNHAVGLKAPVVPPPDFTGVGKVPESLRPFVVYPNADEEIIGVSNAAERLAISRTTVYEWAKTNKLIAWRVAKRVLRIPAKQIISKGHVVPGLKDVVLAIGDPELAWTFLTQEWAFEETVALPLELLKDGRIDEVLCAAPVFGTTFT